MGVGVDGEVLLSEENRESHIHCIGSPGEGKSKLLELLLRQDLDLYTKEHGKKVWGGSCLLDPSDDGETMYKVLKYAIKSGYKKICIIDPHDISEYGMVPVINPIHYNAPADVISANMMDTIRVLWKTQDFSATATIQDYAPAIINAIHAAGMTMAEARWFTKSLPAARYRATQILSHLDPLDDDRLTIEEAFNNPGLYKTEFRSTPRRLKAFRHKTMELILGSKEGMNFQDLVSQGYLVLVNLDPEGVYGQEHQRLLGTIIINEITYAISRLRNSGWRGIYYLYIDEAGDYATSKLSYILDKKRKSGLRLTLSHQRFDQFADKDVSSAVYGGTKIKVLFNTASRDDRDKMIRMMFGGDIQDRDASYFASQLKKQNAIIKIGKQAPVSTKIPDIPDVKMSNGELDAWKKKHYHSHPFYRPVGQVREEISKRFAVQYTPRRPSAGNQPHKPDSPRAAGEPNAEPNRGADQTSATRKSVFDSLPDSPPVLQPKKGRKPSK